MYLIGVLLVVSPYLIASFMPAKGLGGRMMPSGRLSMLKMQGDGLKIDMKGKTVFVAGVADSTGYGWAIAKACAEAGAKIILGTWPPVMPMFQMGLNSGQFAEDMKLSDGSTMEIAKVVSLYNIWREKPHFEL